MSYQAVLFLVCLPALELDVPITADAASWYSLRCVARDLELWPWDGPWNPNFQAELRRVRDRHQELADSPPAADVERLPELELLKAQQAFACEWHDKLIFERDYRWSQAVERACDNQGWRCNCLECMIAAREAAGSWIARRHALRCLRDDYLGAARYHAGDWPDHVDLGLFRRMP